MEPIILIEKQPETEIQLIEVLMQAIIIEKHDIILPDIIAQAEEVLMQDIIIEKPDRINPELIQI